MKTINSFAANVMRRVKHSPTIFKLRTAVQYKLQNRKMQIKKCNSQELRHLSGVP